MEKNTSETLYSLKFAERVRSVELGPSSRRTELGSWSSQEHLEVWSPCSPVPMGQGGEEGSCLKVVESDLNPNPVALYLAPKVIWGVLSNSGSLQSGAQWELVSFFTSVISQGKPSGWQERLPGQPWPQPICLSCSQWEPACQTLQSARAHSAPSSGTNSRPGSIRRKLQPSGESVGSGQREG